MPRQIFHEFDPGMLALRLSFSRRCHPLYTDIHYSYTKLPIWKYTWHIIPGGIHTYVAVTGNPVSAFLCQRNRGEHVIIPGTRCTLRTAIIVDGISSLRWTGIVIEKKVPFRSRFVQESISCRHNYMLNGKKITYKLVLYPYNACLTSSACRPRRAEWSGCIVTPT